MDARHRARHDDFLFRRGSSVQENVSIRLALVSAALRAAIHSSVNFAESLDGLPLMNSFHYAISTS